MTFDWSQYLKLAQELAGQGVTAAAQEARLRSAISRAYYAAFCLARDHLRHKEKHPVPTNGRAHAYVRNQFRNSSDRARKKLGHNLGRLHKDRKRADYDDSVPDLEKTTTSDIILAQRVLHALANL